MTLESNGTLNALSLKGVTLGDNVKIGSNTIISCTGNLQNVGLGLKVDNNSGVGDYSFFGAAGGIEIGESVIMDV